MLGSIFVFLGGFWGHRFIIPFFHVFLAILCWFLKNFLMILWWIFDAASQYRSNMLENMNMLKHCACAVIWRISMFDASTFLLFVLRFSMQNGSKKSPGFVVRLSLRFTSQNRWKMTLKSVKNHLFQKSMQNSTASWHRLFIDFGRFWASLPGPSSATFRQKWRGAN